MEWFLMGIYYHDHIKTVEYEPFDNVYIWLNTPACAMPDFNQNYSNATI